MEEILIVFFKLNEKIIEMSNKLLQQYTFINLKILVCKQIHCFDKIMLSQN